MSFSDVSPTAAAHTTYFQLMRHQFLEHQRHAATVFVAEPPAVRPRLLVVPGTYVHNPYSFDGPELVGAASPSPTNLGKLADQSAADAAAQRLPRDFFMLNKLAQVWVGRTAHPRQRPNPALHEAPTMGL
eukprot:EG_transcript_12025